MSKAITSAQNLIPGAKLPELQPAFTTFSANHFVKPGAFTQPVASRQTAQRTATALSSFAGCYTEVFTAEPLDLDYDEPNAVVDADLELIVADQAVHQHQLKVISDRRDQHESVTGKDQVRSAA